MGGGKAIAGLSPWGRCGAPTTLPSLPPPLALGCCSLGAYSHLAGPPTGIAQCWALGGFQGKLRVAREPQEHPRPARRWPQASKGMAGQEWTGERWWWWLSSHHHQWWTAAASHG